jgi:ArsR family transcriptional regulator, lead/cadmium/zinc/bismuth-responsive transcriptional repressor
VSDSRHGELLHLDQAEGRSLRESWLPQQAAESVAGQFKALSDPTRLGLALALRAGRELCVCDLSWVAERPQNLTSHHMKILKDQGIVAARRDGKMTMYRLTAPGRKLVDAALGRVGELQG